MNILVAMSGGVDSTMTAYLLKQAGNYVEGCYMRLYEDDETHTKNINMVARAANFLKIKYHILDLSKEFDKHVYKPFVQAYKDGLTPNPCVLCNKNIKFGKLVEFAKNIGMDKLATGHYAQIKNGLLCEAFDKSKDQSYFLAQVLPEMLSYILFPLGDKLKKDIKAFALNMPKLKEFSSQKESREICFIQNTYTDVLGKHMDINCKGEVLNTKDEVIGTHQGYMHYTIGKRRGFEVRGAHAPHYVISIIPQKNQIIAGVEEELPNIKNFKVNSLNIFTNNITEAFVKIRYRSQKVKCSIFIDADKQGASVLLQNGIKAVAHGQLAVFYQDECIVGSGIIA